MDNTVQPDSILCLDQGTARGVKFDTKGYLVGAPELIAEVAASTAVLDLGEKLNVYRRNGVGEYIVWCTLEEDFHWFVLRGGQFVRQAPPRSGVLRSVQFPGLALDVKALLARNGRKVLATLETAMRSAKHRDFCKTLRRR